MNPIRQAFLPQQTAVRVNAGQQPRSSGPQAQTRHAQKLSLVKISNNSLRALDDHQHEPPVKRAIESINDSDLDFKSEHQADAHYATPDGSLTVHARLNEQLRYDIISISPPNANPVYLQVPPPVTTHYDASASMAAQTSPRAYPAHPSRSNLTQTLIEQHNPGEATNTTGADLIKTAQNLMQHGTLSLSGTEIGQRYGNLMYKATYQPHSPINIENSSYADFLPGQSDLVGEHLEFYKDEFRRGLSGRQEPIIAAPTEHGPLVIVEGHHRFAAALATGMPIKVMINTDKESAADQNWSNVSKINKGDDGYETDVPSYKQRGM
ncbi:ParB-like nuclease domain-containing protein [Pseudomonas congelans]|uniref:ParB-like nuclease domain-containing protein n=1 Tax=Pseudomonas congelans TaxID=200452 RepID=A0A1H0W1L8_9PSED|nr:ParB/Srx family N-terminal domain-containing protein [Pseudomonas congelans]SDP84425.1 ParB-like nuclease domain-containing protein [Pseudomonas congelans]